MGELGEGLAALPFFNLWLSNEQCSAIFALLSGLALAAVAAFRLGHRLHLRLRAHVLRKRLNDERTAILRALDMAEGSATDQLDALAHWLREGSDDA